MNRKIEDTLGQAVAFSVAKAVLRFRKLHAWLLSTIGFALSLAVLCLACCHWFPAWPVPVLAVLLVGDAICHSQLNRAFEEGQVEAWERVFRLTGIAEARARSAALRPPSQPPKPTKAPTQLNRPPFRVFWPEEPPGEQP